MDQRVVTICSRNGQVIAKYEAMIPGSLAAPPIMNEQIRQSLIDAAKDGLTLEHKAHPPFEGVTFKVVLF